MSLTCILGKCMEHIIVSSISTHLDTNKNFNSLQHGFSLGNVHPVTANYCWPLFHNLASVPSETDMIVIDLARLLIRCHTGDSYTSLSGMGSGVDSLTGSSAYWQKGSSWWYSNRVSSGTCFVRSTSGFGSGPYPFPYLHWRFTW